MLAVFDSPREKPGNSLGITPPILVLITPTGTRLRRGNGSERQSDQVTQITSTAGVTVKSDQAERV